MEKKNQYMEVAYQLFVDGEDGLEMMEEATKERPFQLITGFGVALDAFEKELADLEKGATFDFSIPKEQAYGEYLEEHVLDLEHEMFCVNGQFDHEHIYEDAIIPLQNEEGQRFYGRVVEVGAEKVKVDLNHPLAGETLHFKGSVLESRPATTKEIEQLVAHLTGGCGGCGGGCHGDQGCGGGCDCGNCN
ncbi:MAG: FKBP-type peptidyl-prolyl cis-trans isomerase [Prevotella sp.]|nr:FKBP-type peptidyl-prolyl cis-trans isomerase [Prevotella sp.]